jgi:hypothetical protein
MPEDAPSCIQPELTANLRCSRVPPPLLTGLGPSLLEASSLSLMKWCVGGNEGHSAAGRATERTTSLFDLNTWLPSFYEAVVNAKWVSGGSQSNAFIIFDYQDALNFKYAGIDGANNLIKIGQRSATGWTDLATLSVKGLTGKGYNSFKLTSNFTTAGASFCR